MKVRILGSAAGGGVPQWNCQCANCRSARQEKTHNLRRTQSSIAVSADGKRWLLVNASPDLSSQIAAFPALSFAGKKLRGSSIEAVLLTDAEMDHTAGLLSLREGQDLQLVCSRAVKILLTQRFPLLPTLQHYCRLRVSDFPFRMGPLRVYAIDVGSKAPPYAKGVKRRGLVQGLRFESPTGKFVYLPGLERITPAVEKFVEGCDCLLVDGTFWSDREMISLGLSKRTALDMGHVSIDGPSGSLAWLRRLTIPRKVYIHINNTNPVLRKTSPERRAVERAGIEVAHDGMDINV